MPYPARGFCPPSRHLTIWEAHRLRTLLPLDLHTTHYHFEHPHTMLRAVVSWRRKLEGKVPVPAPTAINGMAQPGGMTPRHTLTAFVGAVDRTARPAQDSTTARSRPSSRR